MKRGAWSSNSLTIKAGLGFSQPCFFGEEYYQAYLYWLGEVLKKEQCALHAYALMTNHVHLLVTPVRAESTPLRFVRDGA
ncbi:MAG: transposase [Candidatus Nitrotoga sp.]